ncbi:hypothetical protein Zmor_022055 [Zophobas morio]|uniref:Gustatory receptor n=1 Tax=Zophobas morio TaxID=2755281 RepID=A0AA38MBY4_9CUCU|nr:hypothetical protein Zmor_022055 [Zophobas morio]
MSTNSDSAIIDDAMNTTELTMFFLLNVTIVILSNKKRQEISRVIDALKYSEWLIVTLKRQNVSYTNSVKKGVLKLATVKYGVIIILCIVDCVNIPEDRVDLITYYFSWSFHFLFELVIFAYFLILRSQYDELNDFLLRQNFEITDHRTIQNLIGAYSLLRKISKLVKSISEVFILVKAIADTIVTSVAVFYSLRMYSVLPDNLLLSTTSNILYYALTAISNFTLAYVFHDLLEKDELFMDHINRVLNSPTAAVTNFKKNTLFAVDNFLNKLEFLVCGLFPLDCTYICWMITSVAGYVVYLVQLNKIT